MIFFKQSRLKSIFNVDHRYQLTICLFIGISFRLLWILFIDFSQNFSNPGDSTFYIEMANNIIEHGIYGKESTPGFFRAPLYSYFIGICSFIPGYLRFNVIAVQHLLTILVSIFSWNSLKNIFNKNLLALWIALWIASPASSFQDSLILQESLYTNLCIIVIVLSFLYIKSNQLLYAILIGFFVGITLWVREVFLFLPGFLFLSFVFIKGSAIKPLKFLLIMFICTLLTISPWLYRNYRLTDGKIFLSKGIMGLSLYIGTWQSDSNWNQQWLTGINLPERAFDETSNRLEIKNAMANRSITNDNILISEAKRRIFNNPINTIKTWFFRSYYMWIGTRSDLVHLKLNTHTLPWFIFKSFLWVVNFFIVFLGSLGMLITIYSNKLFSIPASLIAYNYLIYLPFLNIETRYSHPSYPWLLLFSLLAVIRIINTKKRNISLIQNKKFTTESRL